MDAPPVKDESVEKLSVEKLEEQRLQADSDAVGTTSTEIFSDYRPSHPNGGPAHPGDVAEAASLAARRDAARTTQGGRLACTSTARCLPFPA